MSGAARSLQRRLPLFMGFLLLLLTVSLLSCRRTDEPDPCAAPDALFFDDFEEDPACGWLLYDDSGLVAEIVDGQMQISTSQPGKIAWTNPNRTFDDLVVRVRTRQMAGPDDNAYGVICRYVDQENFYIFLISGDGFYAIGKYESGRPQIRYLTGDGAYVYSEAINQGQANNDIEASCIGDELRLTVNGLRLATVTDDAFPAGDIGLGTSTLDPGTAVIRFDNIRVQAP